MLWIYLVLAALVLVVGVAVVLVNRRRAAAGQAPPSPPAPSIERPPRPAGPSAPKAAVPDGAGAAGDVVAVDEQADSGTDDAAPVAVVERPTFRGRMAKARSALAGAFLGIRARGGITADTWDDLEEALLKADVGVRVADELLDPLKARVKAKEITDPDQLLDALQAEMVARLAGADRELRFDESPVGPNVWLFVGVNGVGKTTTIGKVAARQRAEGRSVMMAAGDTFRAAAAEQLETWAQRSGADMVRGNEGGDPSAVIFDAVESATARRIGLVLGDTAGRLHTKTNLMDELSKVRRVAAKGAGRVTEVLLVVDATTGQNGLTQAREFGRATNLAGSGADSGVTGVVLTKLDGSAKGGIVFAIETELGLPVKLVGLGEGIDDLIPFDPAEFIAALFATD